MTAPLPLSARHAAARASRAERIRELAAGGATDPQIAAALDCAVGTVRRSRLRFAIPAGARAGRPVNGWQERLAAAVDEVGTDRARLAAVLGWAVKTVELRLQSQGYRREERDAPLLAWWSDGSTSRHSSEAALDRATQRRARRGVTRAAPPE